MVVEGKLLREYRKRNDLSREALAEILDITAKTIQRIENNESTKESTILSIEEKLGIEIHKKDNFTETQKTAINSTSDNLKILAGAGAGKTRVAEEIIAKKLSEGLKPSELIVCTFTEKAAMELKMRTQKRLKIKGIDIGAADIVLGTIHGICMRLLQDYGKTYSDFTVLDTMKNIHFINRHFKKIGVDQISKLNSRNEKMLKYYDTNRFLTICNIVEENPSDWKLIPENLRTAILMYRKILRDYHYFDFSTIQSLFLQELRTNDVFRNKINENIKFLIVDEYQDVNFLQSEIVKEFISLGVRVIVIGDADQAIYQFRGSDYSYIKNFESTVKNVEVVKLEDNFRSTEGIIQIAESSISHNLTREDKKMISQNGIYERGDIIYKEFNTPKEECNFIADRIEELIRMGMPPREIAVLFRKKKYMQPLADELKRRNIPIEIENISSLLATEEISAVVKVFRYIAHDISKNELIDSWGFSEVYIKNEDLINAVNYLDECVPEVWTKNNPSRMNQEYLLQEIYQNFIGLTGIVGYNNAEVAYERIMFNLGKFSQLINDYEVVNFDFPPEAKIVAFNAFLCNTKDEYPEGYLSETFRKTQGVQIMTVHKSKGLQFSAVFIPTLCHNIFPSSRVGGRNEWHFLPEGAVLNSSVLRATGNRALEDERRVFYVAVTRSRKFLFLTRADYGSSRTNKASEFLSEALSASGYIFEYDNRICNYESRKKWQPYADEEAVFTIDFTNLSEYFNCDYGFKLSQIYGFTSPINLRMGYGASIHNMAKEINRYVLETGSDKISEDKMAEIFDSFYLPFVGGASKVKEVLFEKAKKCIKKYVIENANKFSEVEYVEKYIEVPIREDILVSGRIDLIRKKDIAGKWHVIIVDYKTGNKIPSELEQHLQLEIYALGYKNLTGENADVMEIINIEGNKVVSSRAVIQESLDETAVQIENACDSILDSLYNIRQCSEEKCKKCVQRNLCYAK